MNDTFTFVIMESFFLFIFATILFINKKINNHINSMQEVNRVNNILLKHYPDEKQAIVVNNLSNNNQLFDDNKSYNMFEGHIDAEGRYNPIPNSPSFNPLYDD